MYPSGKNRKLFVVDIIMQFNYSLQYPTVLKNIYLANVWLILQYNKYMINNVV